MNFPPSSEIVPFRKKEPDNLGAFVLAAGHPRIIDLRSGRPAAARETAPPPRRPSVDLRALALVFGVSGFVTVVHGWLQ